MKKFFKVALLSVLGVLVFLFIFSFFLPDAPVAERAEKPLPVKDAFHKEEPFVKLASKAETAVHALDLINAYEENEFAADAKYKGKIVMVRGAISNMHDTFGMSFVNLESVNFIVSVSCEMQKSQIPRLQQLRKGQDVVVVGIVRGSTAGLSVDLKNCAIMSVEDYRKFKQ